MFVYILYVPLATALLRGTLFVLSLDDPPPRWKEREHTVWCKCVALVAAVCVVGFLSFPIGFILANVVSLLGIKILFYDSFGMAFFAFICYSVLLWLSLWGIGQFVS